jgi:hypothetical protein
MARGTGSSPLGEQYLAGAQRGELAKRLRQVADCLSGLSQVGSPCFEIKGHK